MPRIIILGAGLTGLSCGYFLKKSGFDDFVIFEKENKIGGLARTIRKDGYSYDFTGHALHIKNDEIKHLIFNELCLADKLRKIKRKAIILHNGKIIPYPFQMNLFYLDKLEKAKCLLDFLERRIDFTQKMEFDSFYDYCYSTLGSGISESFMIPYNQKLWATSAQELTTDWIGRFVPIPAWKDVVKYSLEPFTEAKIGYNAEFYYPDYGIDLLPNAISEKAQLSSNTILDSEFQFLNIEDKTIELTNGKSIRFDRLLSTLPLKKLMEKSSSPALAQRSNLLRATYLTALIIAIPKGKLFPFSWAYMPDENFMPYRIGNFNYFSDNLCRKDEELLYVEISSARKFLNNLNEKIKYELSMAFGIKEARVIDTLNIEPAYCIHDHNRKSIVDFAESFLRKNSIFVSGRFGGWKYDSMEGAIIDGRKIAECFLKDC